jgi:hypothetical protein
MVAAGFFANKVDQPCRATADGDQSWQKNEPTRANGISSQFLQYA